MGKMFSSLKSKGSMESNRLGSTVECKFQILTAFVRHRLRVLGAPHVWQHDQPYVWVVNFGHHEKFSFALRADHGIDGEDSTEERCPVDSVSFVFHRLGCRLLSTSRTLLTFESLMEQYIAGRGYILFVTCATTHSCSFAPEKFNTPDIVNIDEGSEFTSDDFTDILKSWGVNISINGKGRRGDDVVVERLWRSVKYAEVYLKAYETVGDVRWADGSLCVL